jgi:hypothetical protein
MDQINWVSNRRQGSKPDIPLCSDDVCFTPKADIVQHGRDVRFVPKAHMQTILWLSPKRCSFDEIASGILTAFSRLNCNGSTIDSRIATSQVKPPKLHEGSDRGETRTGYQKALR